MKFLIDLYNKIRPKTIRELEYEYLAESVDLIDLERRQKILYNTHRK